MSRAPSRRDFLARVGKSAAGFTLLSAFPSWALSSPKATRAWVERKFYAMGSTASITAVGGDRQLLLHATTKAIEEFSRIENALSLFLAKSDISRINGASGRTEVEVGEDCLQVVRWSKEMTRKSRGGFDITVGPLMDLWGFRANKISSVPTDEQLRASLASVGAENIIIDDQQRAVGLTHPSARIDLGGIGIGYALDRATDILKREGVEAAFVNHSGDAVAWGAPDESDGWEIGIPDPGEPDHLLQRRSLRDGAVATSGGYRQFVSLGSRRFAHVLDPRSGIPGTPLHSATVFAQNAMTADALSTSLYCLSTGEAERVLAGFPGTSLLLLSRDECETMTNVIERQGGT